MRNISTEDYVKHIHNLQGSARSVSTSALAASLRVTDASVTEMMKRLAERRLVRYRPYQGVALTEEGRLMAMRTLRRHRLWEMYLVRFLGYSWDSVHDEAERLEHATSDGLEEALDRALGYPPLDPHGDPIPTRAGELHNQSMPSLSSAEAGAVLRVRRVSDGDPALLQHMTRLGLRLNTRMTVKERLAFDGSIRLVIRGKEQVVSEKVAGCIFVEPA
jgi:DtxR family Mn-dependent transcriptional regulator